LSKKKKSQTNFILGVEVDAAAQANEQNDLVHKDERKKQTLSHKTEYHLTHWPVTQKVVKTHVACQSNITDLGTGPRKHRQWNRDGDIDAYLTNVDLPFEFPSCGTRLCKYRCSITVWIVVDNRQSLV
jgi:hypothetical protein